MALKAKALKKQENKWYHKYRWFYTSNNLLVVGGKSAEQNEELVKKFMPNGRYIVMHTKSPGSPFSIINSDKCSNIDLEETEIFTASFSRAWRENKKSEYIETFLRDPIIKKKSMKTGTFGVIGEVDRKKIDLKLYLTSQEGKIRAIPYQQKGSINSIKIVPGKINKDQFAEQIAIKLEVPLEEVLQALPTGGFKITK